MWKVLETHLEMYFLKLPGELGILTQTRRHMVSDALQVQLPNENSEKRRVGKERVENCSLDFAFALLLLLCGMKQVFPFWMLIILTTQQV